MHMPPAEPLAEAGETPSFWPNGDAGPFLQQRDFVVPVLGAGISAGASLPGSADLAAWIVANVPAIDAYTDERDPDLFTVAAQVAIDERSLRERIATLLAGYELRPTPFTEAIVRCPSHFIVTLNYDLLLEETAVRAGLSYRSLVGDEDGLEEAVRLVGSPERWPPEDLVILHLHGSVEEPDSIVLGPKSYKQLANRGEFSDLVLLLMLQKTMLFLGTTLDEVLLLEQMRRHRADRRHVLLCPAEQKSRLTEGRLAISERRDGIIIETFAQFAELDGFAAKLAIFSPIPIPPEPILPCLPDRPAGFQYVPNVLLRYGDLRTDDTDAAAAAILGRRYGSAPFGERDVALGQRTLIVGAPGSGKTELLREAGQLLPQGESAILIRCSNLIPYPASR